MISNKVILQRGFNELFFKFIDEIISMFSNDSDFIIARTTFETLKKANPSSIIKAWYNFITITFLKFSQQNVEEKEEYERKEVKYNVIVFLKNFELSDQNKISELNNFFVKLKSEFDKMFNIRFPPQNVEDWSSPLNSEQNAENSITESNKAKLVVIESYFNQLNKLAISFHV